MSLRPVLLHSCFDQNRIMAFMEPFLYANVTKEQLAEMWGEAAQQLGEVRNKNCRCSYRVTTEEAEKLVENGLASYLVIEWRYNAEKKVFFPAPNPNLVWGGKQAEDLGLVKSAYAGKTPRVMTIEKANMERAYLDENQDEIERIEEWGRLQRLVWTALLTPARPDPWGEGRPFIYSFNTERGTVGKDVAKYIDKDACIVSE